MQTSQTFHHDPRESKLARTHPKAYLVLHAMAGVALMALLLFIFSILADEVPEQGWMTKMDTAISTYAGTHSTEWGEKVFVVISLMGAQILGVLVALFVVLNAVKRDWLRAWTLAIGVVAGALIDVGLKQVFRRGRPEFATEFIAHHTWSFPSGHAFNSLVAYGLLLALSTSRRHDWRFRALAASVVIIVGVARVYLAVHYLSDVIAGWLAASVWLFVVITGYRFARLRFPRPATNPLRV